MDLSLINDLLLYAVAAVGAARLIVQGIAKITAITPSTRDDELISAAQRVIARVQGVLGTIALPGDGAEKTVAKKATR